MHFVEPPGADEPAEEPDDGQDGEEEFHARLLPGCVGHQVMGWAQVWRTLYRDEALRNQIMTNPHSPGYFRAIGPLVNNAAFYRAFDVKEGDKMFRPADQRVIIW